jgi:hypothetical protein
MFVIYRPSGPAYRPSEWLGSRPAAPESCPSGWGCRAHQATNRSVSADTASARSSPDKVGSNTGDSTATGRVREPCPAFPTLAMPKSTPIDVSGHAHLVRHMTSAAIERVRSASGPGAVAVSANLRVRGRYRQHGTFEYRLKVRIVA